MTVDKKKLLPQSFLLRPIKYCSVLIFLDVISWDGSEPGHLNSEIGPITNL